MTSKIQSVDSVKEWSGQHGTTYYHNLTMENGDKINIGKKSQVQVGWELDYDIVEHTGTYNKAKSVKREEFQQNTPHNTPATQSRGGGSKNNKSFALSYAKDLVIKKLEVSDYNAKPSLELAHTCIEVAKEFEKYLDA